MDIFILHQSIRKMAKADFSRSGGPGGQNVNKVNTKVTLRISIESLAGLNDTEMNRLRGILASRINSEDELIITASEERSQHNNLERAYTRMEALIVTAGRLPRIRRPTKPSRAAREERLSAKHHRGLVKANRRFKPED